MSTLARHLDDYLRLRRMLGHKLDDAARQLPWFVEYLDATDNDYVTTAAALAWALDRDWPAGSTVPGHRMTAVRGFARYLTGIDARTEVPPPGLIRIPRTWRPPFIYTDDDVLALMDAARRSIREPLRAATYETLIGLLATTGLRIGEALRLDRDDIDEGDAVLLIRRSKFGKSRHVRAATQRPGGAAALPAPPPPALPAPQDRRPVCLVARHPRHLRVRLADLPPALRPSAGRRRRAARPDPARLQALLRRSRAA